uniref:cytochrome o ubiquinol oxidase subunit IV n=1 Tax=Candidatus Fukatsuia anoeciicola TaxID=2994492 RepID=UPI003F5CCDA3
MGVNHESLKSYLIGFVFSIILTVIPFVMVIYNNISHNIILITVVAFALVQIFIHLVYFLHMNQSSTERWNLVAFIFTIIVVTIIIIGSLWIMYNLDINMTISNE